MRTGIYLRVSTEEQKEHGYSIRAQREKLEAYCVSQDWHIVDVYNDEGHSAKDTSRPQLTRMIEDIKQGKLDVVLVYRLDRFTRSVLDLHSLLKVFDEYNCKFKSATEPFDTTSATGRMFITLVAAMAEWERGVLIERVNLAMNKKANLGEWSGGIAPFGYYHENKQLYINEEERPIVERIFELSRHYGMRRVADILNSEGKHMRGSLFNRSTVTYITRNPIYIGKIRYNEDAKSRKKPLHKQRIFDGQHEPIISEELFEEVNRSEYRKTNKHVYYFTGIVKCFRCGSNMQGATGKVKYYRCGNARQGQCDLPMVKEDNIAKELLKHFDEIIGNQQIKLEEESKQKQPDYEQELKQIRSKMDKHKQLFLNDLIGMEELNQQIESLRKREKEIEREKNQSSESLDEEILINFDSLWQDSNDHEKKMLVQSIFKELLIEVNDTNRYDKKAVLISWKDVDGLEGRLN